MSNEPNINKFKSPYSALYNNPNISMNQNYNHSNNGYHNSNEMNVYDEIRNSFKPMEDNNRYFSCLFRFLYITEKNISMVCSQSFIEKREKVNRIKFIADCILSSILITKFILTLKKPEVLILKVSRFLKYSILFMSFQFDFWLYDYYTRFNEFEKTFKDLSDYQIHEKLFLIEKSLGLNIKY
jgi:hypothetical protein